VAIAVQILVHQTMVLYCELEVGCSALAREVKSSQVREEASFCDFSHRELRRYLVISVKEAKCYYWIHFSLTKAAAQYKRSIRTLDLGSAKYFYD